MTVLETITQGVYLYRQPIPIPALKHVNTYFILGDNCLAIIDPGMGEEGARRLESIIREEGLPELGTVVVTHFHVDHSTAAGFLGHEPILVMGRDDWKWIEYMVSEWPRPAREVADLYASHGMPRSEADQLTSKHPAFSRIKLFEKLVERYEPRLLGDNDRVMLCGRSYRVLWVPGHTPGHIALIEEDKAFMIVGDHVLADITPNIPMIIWDLNPLGDYLESLSKVEEAGAKLLLPGHRRLINEPAKRIRELRIHHTRRLCEMLGILLSRPGLTVYEAASQMTWDVPFKSWSEFPLSQKYFAHAEALSHAKHLAVSGIIEFYERMGTYRIRVVDEARARSLCKEVWEAEGLQG
ncbi:MAG: MBL fold metallo-hydrolase [Pyrodictiaceae archaeon]